MALVYMFEAGFYSQSVVSASFGPLIGNATRGLIAEECYTHLLTELLHIKHSTCGQSLARCRAQSYICYDHIYIS